MDQRMVLDEIEQCREQLHQLINQKLNKFILQMTCGDLSPYLEGSDAHAVPFISSAAACKGTKPVAVLLPSGELVETNTWKKAILAILRDCDADLRLHEQMRGLRGRVSGNFRPLLSETMNGMGAPLKISDQLYLKSKFDTGALLDNVTRKILDRIGYDYSSIAVFYQDPRQEMAQEQETVEPMLSM